MNKIEIGSSVKHPKTGAVGRVVEIANNVRARVEWPAFDYWKNKNTVRRTWVRIAALTAA